MTKRKQHDAVVSIEFRAGHSGKFKKECPENKEHWHSWRGAVYLHSDKLNDERVVVGFGTPREIAKRLDEKYINDMPEFKDEIPTTEVIAQWIGEQIPECYRVTLQETSTTSGGWNRIEEGQDD